MSAEGVDFSGDRPTPAQLKAAGKTFVMRYVGSKIHGKGRDVKWLDPVEARDYHEAGIDVGVVFETAANRADDGRSAGLVDAHSAEAELTYCGLPPNLPVYFAVDWDTTVGPKITAYFDAVNEVLGVERSGVYGGIKVVDALMKAGLVKYGWQTLAWSGGAWGRAKLQQYAINESLAGHEVDLNRALADDVGLWRAGTDEIKSEEKDMPAADLPARGNVPNGYSVVEFSFPVGSIGAIGLVHDNTYSNADAGIEAQPVAQVRVTAHRKGRKGEVLKGADGKDVIQVGASDGKGWADKVVLHVTNPKDTDYVTVLRLDDGKRPVGIDMS